MVNIRESIKEFVEKRGNVNTQKTYSQVLNTFSKILLEKNIEITSENCQNIQQEAELFVGQVAQTRNLRIGVLNNFFSNYYDFNPFVHVKRISEGREIKATRITKEQFAKIADTIDRATKKGKRDLALISLMLDTGLTISEICRQTTHNFVYVGGVVKIYENSYMLSVNVYTSQIIIEWLNELYNHESSSPLPVWIGFSPKTRDKNIAMSHSGIASVIKSKFGVTTPYMKKEELLNIMERLIK